MLAHQYAYSHVHKLLSVWFAILHATAPEDMAICHRLGPLINTAPASHDSSQCTHTHTIAHSSSDRWVKRWATSCVKWTEGRGVLAIMVKQTAKRDRHVCVFVCVCTTKGAHGHVQRNKPKQPCTLDSIGEPQPAHTEDNLNRVHVSVYGSLPYSLNLSSETHNTCKIQMLYVTGCLSKLNSSYCILPK